MSATLPAADLQDLAAELRGELVLPADPGFAEARLAWNLAADQRPVAVALPADAADVAAVVRHAAGRGLRVAPQGTGHGATARSSLEGSILLRTDRLREVTVDPVARTCRVGAGVLWLEVLEAIEPHGLVALCGSSPDVGVVGYTLGGGIGWLSRALGLASDSVVAIEVVTGDGRELRCTADEHADLFWALRGGSGSFGVVTAMELALHEVTGIVGGAMLFDWERAGEVLHRWLEITRTAPETLTTSARIMQFPPMPELPDFLRGRQLVVVDGAVIGTPEEADALLAPLRELGPEVDLWAPMGAAGLARIHMDPEHPLPARSDHTLLRDVDTAAIDALVAAAGPGSGSPLLMVELRHLGGALARRAPGCGALGAIDAGFAFFAVSPAVPELVPAVEAHLPRIRDALRPFEAGRHYLNFQDAPTDVAGALAIDVHTRLRQVKRAYDGADVVHANHPIRPLAD